MAEPVKVSGAPGATVNGRFAVGGFISCGVVTATVGASAVALTSFFTAALRRSD